ncbi:MAG: hypothetical protein FRX48_00789 [Lasallia pustulata]|uniref:HD domain-containing protein n=1 Tax=Lasallia pustulata TaxID=136370 RepID=A0A5M8Q3T4_9LECA|nr:MAG: hypothetical protein FRX48_00789 [Lasallia pustulata]
MTDPIKLHGFTALPRDPKVLLNGQKNIHAPTPISVDQIQVPSSPLATATHDYVKKALSPPTYAHSMRVYYYGLAIARQQFPSWEFSEETYFLACMLHDIGATTENLRKTLMSFEFYGGVLALHLLQSEGYGAEKDQAEAVAEAIIRHQDIGEPGKITTIGQLIQLATIFDNMGGHADLVHEETIHVVTSEFPRQKWSSCFAATIREENKLKPWAHTTALGEEDFPNGVLNNRLMERYD